MYCQFTYCMPCHNSTCCKYSISSPLTEQGLPPVILTLQGAVHHIHLLSAGLPAEQPVTAADTRFTG